MRTTLVLCFLVLMASLACGGADARSDNEGIFRSLPALPGAELVSVDTQPYRDCRALAFGRILGYTTSAVYRVPRDVTAQQVVDFYTEQLTREWNVRQVDTGVISADPPLQTPRPSPTDYGSIPMAYYEKGTAAIGVLTHEMVLFGRSPGQSSYQFRVEIDSRGTEAKPYCD